MGLVKKRVKMLRRKENKKRLGIFLISFFLISFFLIRGGITGMAIGAEKADVEEEVLKALGEKGKVPVIVVLEDTAASTNLDERKEAIREKQEEVLENLNLEEEKGFLGIWSEENEFDLTHKYSTVNAFSGEVTEEGLEKLENDPNVEKIYFNKVLHLFLDESVPQINADDVWSLSVSGINIAGAGETICIIDTGIDTDHSAFAGRIVNQYCYCGGNCCPNGQPTDSNAEDDHGHGTHVAGIAAGDYGVYRGVAPEAGIIAIKVCSGSGNCNTDDVISAIDWCVNNASKYNISVISISLGEEEGALYNNTYCDDNSYGIAPGINSAVAEDIGVVIAAGNNGGTNGISIPACVENATPIGGVDSTDGILYNRGYILDLLAPGSSITAPYKGGGTATISGTSMSTPHAAGAFALFRQYWRLAYGLTPTPQQIEHKFILTGKPVDDTGGSGKSYSRIDVLKAIQPFISFTTDSLAKGTVQKETSALVNITSDIDLTGALLEWNYGNGTIENTTMNKNSATNFYYIMAGLSNGTHTYRVYGNDLVNTGGVSEERDLKIDFTLIELTINYPENNSYHKEGFNLNISIADADLTCSLYNITNPAGEVLQENSNLSIGASLFNWLDLVDVSNSSFADGDYSLSVFANDSSGNFRIEEVNFIVDKTEPSFSGFDKHPAVIHNDKAVIFYVNATDANRNDSGILIEGNWTGYFVNYTMSLEAGDRFYYFVSSGNFSNQEKVGYRFYAFDLLGNMNKSELFDFTVQNRAPLVNITNPANGTVTEAGGSVQFNASASDPDNDSLTYSWNFGDSTSSSEQAPLKQFNSTGEFIAALNVSDGYDFNLSSMIIIVNDTQPPESRSISYNDDMYVENSTSSTNQTVEAAFFDYSGIFNISLYFDGAAKEGSCTESGASWNCSWSWEISSYGDYSFTIEAIDNSIMKHARNETYDFSARGCGDDWADDEEDCDGSDLSGENCVSQDYDTGTLACSSSCTFDTSGCSSEDSGDDGGSDSGGGSGGSGGGSGGGSTTTTAAPEAAPEEAVEIGEAVEETIEPESEEPYLALASADSNLMAASEAVEDAAEGKTSLTGMAVGFLKGIKGWGTKGKALLILGALIVILLVTYSILQRREQD